MRDQDPPPPPLPDPAVSQRQGKVNINFRLILDEIRCPYHLLRCLYRGNGLGDETLPKEKKV